MINVPNTQSLEELRTSIEFIQAVSTKSGLAEIVGRISDERKEVQKERAALAVEKESTKEAIEENEKLVNAQARNFNLAQAAEAEAKEAHEAANERISQAESKEIGLKQDIQRFEIEKSQATNAINDRNAELSAAEKELCAAREKAEDLIKDYSAQIAALKKITG